MDEDKDNSEIASQFQSTISVLINSISDYPRYLHVHIQVGLSNYISVNMDTMSYHLYFK